MELTKWLDTIQDDLDKIRITAGELGGGDDPLYLDMEDVRKRISSMIERLHTQIGLEACKPNVKV